MANDVNKNAYSTNPRTKPAPDIQPASTGDNTSNFNQSNPTPTDKTKTQTEIRKQLKLHTQQHNADDVTIARPQTEIEHINNAHDATHERKTTRDSV